MGDTTVGRPSEEPTTVGGSNGSKEPVSYTTPPPPKLAVGQTPRKPLSPLTDGITTPSPQDLIDRAKADFARQEAYKASAEAARRDNSTRHPTTKQWTQGTPNR